MGSNAIRFVRRLFTGAKAAAKGTRGLGRQVGKTNPYDQRVFRKQITKPRANGYEKYELQTVNFDGTLGTKVTVERSYDHTHIVKETPVNGTNARNRTESITWKQNHDDSRPPSYDNYLNGHTRTTRSTYNPKKHTVTREETNFRYQRDPQTGGIDHYEINTSRTTPLDTKF